MRSPRRPWSRWLVVSWLLFAVSFALAFFIYAPLALPLVQRARVAGASAEVQQAAFAVLGVGGVLAVGIVLGLLGVLVCGIGWFLVRRREASGVA